jgi:uncharacterized membrane protein YgaE (UPF0421/DUF939 family)
MLVAKSTFKSITIIAVAVAIGGIIAPLFARLLSPVLGRLGI